METEWKEHSKAETHIIEESARQVVGLDDRPKVDVCRPRFNQDLLRLAAVCTAATVAALFGLRVPFL